MFTSAPDPLFPCFYPSFRNWLLRLCIFFCTSVTATPHRSQKYFYVGFLVQLDNNFIFAFNNSVDNKYCNTDSKRPHCCCRLPNSIEHIDGQTDRHTQETDTQIMLHLQQNNVQHQPISSHCQVNLCKSEGTNRFVSVSYVIGYCICAMSVFISWTCARYCVMLLSVHSLHEKI